MKQIDLREGARRQHRAIGIFAVLQCWARGLDGICFQRQHLSRLIGLDRFKGKRIEWLQSDLREFFDHQEQFVFGPGDSLYSLFVSRISLALLPTGKFEDAARIARIPKRGPRIGILLLWPHPATWEEDRLKDGFEAFIPFLSDLGNYDERLLSSYLSLLMSGQLSLPSLIEVLPKPEPDDE